MGNGQQYLFVFFEVIGGLALFIFGMDIMAHGLQDAAGRKLRSILSKATKNSWVGLGLGTAIGFLVQSSAASVMVVGFINAGLMRLAESVPIILGANVGTTLSMQLISFKISDYSFMAIGLGFLFSVVAPRKEIKAGGRALLGFGLLFLGMSVMSSAIKPYRAELAPLLMNVNGSTWQGTLLGVGLATAITAVIQSSGATIGMMFAMINAGVITDLAGAYPVIIGANIGTCATAMLGSIGANIEARRAAFVHLYFNLFSAVAGILTAPLLYWIMPLISGDLLHQAANANTVKMIFTALVVVPFAAPFSRLVVFLTPSRKKVPVPSFLDDDLLVRPEQVVTASIRELQRVAGICCESLVAAKERFVKPDRKLDQLIVRNEETVDEIKRTMHTYLVASTTHYLSKRQSLMIQHIGQCMADLERISDHIDRIHDIHLEREQHKRVPVVFDSITLEGLSDLFARAINILRLVIDSFDPERVDFNAMASDIVSQCAGYAMKSTQFKLDYQEHLASRGVGMPPIAGIFLNQYIHSLDHIVRHSKAIAFIEQQPRFMVKKSKLSQAAPDQPYARNPEPAADYIEQLFADRM